MIPVSESCYITTASGSIYRLTPTAWQRLAHHPSSDALRSEEGTLLGLGEELAVGRPAILLGPPVAAGTSMRIIATTPVVVISDHDPRQ